MRTRAADLNRQAVFADEENDPPFSAEIFTDPNVATSALNIDEENEPLRVNYLDFDPKTEFLAVFATRFRFNQATWCPDLNIRNGQVIFELPISDWPSELESPFENWVVMTLWEHNGNDPPAQATVQILLPDTSSNIRTCPE